jgi:putative glycosyltransferase (TIGR04372 family)
VISLSLFSKILDRFKLLIKLVIGLVGTFIIVLLSPVIFVRVGYFQSARIGHYVTETQLAINQNRIKKRFRRRFIFDIWFDNRIISNIYVQKYWRTQCRVWDRRFVSPIYTVMKLCKLPKAFFIEAISRDRDVTDCLNSIQPPDLFSDDESNELRKSLESIGLPIGAKYICFHNRDAEYLQRFFPSIDFSSHSYRDTSLSNYIKGLEVLAERGYFVIRMGKCTTEKVPLEVSSRIIDYANSSLQSDVLDIFLISKCDYFISTSAGIDSVATFFKKPTLFLNFPNLAYIANWNSNAMYSFKHFICSDTLNELKLDDIINYNLHSFLKTEDYINNKIDLVENSPEENLEYMVEFDEYFKSKGFLNLVQKSDLEDKFWNIFPFNPNLHPMHLKRCKISNIYLKKSITL